MYILEILNIFDLLAMFIVSLILNTVIFSSLRLGYLGKNLKENFNFVLNKRQNLLSIFIFIFSLLLLFCLNNNVIFLDENVVVTTKIKDSTFVMSGEMINTIFTNLGSAGVFVAGARIAASLVAKHPMHLLPKTGVIGGVAAGFTATFRTVTHFSPSSNLGSTTVNTGPVEIKIEGLNVANSENSVNNEYIKGLLDQYFGVLTKISNNKSAINFTEEKTGNMCNISGNVEQTSKIVQELDKLDPNWKEGFINSPLEIGNSLTQFVLEALSNQLIFNFVTVYLLIMLLIIFICKLVLSKDIQFTNLKKYPLGNYINKFLVKYISIWQTSGNVWIFLIVISLIIFNIVSTFSTYQLIILLK